jgi:hypothetical protein
MYGSTSLVATARRSSPNGGPSAAVTVVPLFYMPSASLSILQG